MKYRQTIVDLENYWKEQIYFIKRSSKMYDEGYDIEAKSMATSLRVLFHQTRSSNSLLKQLQCHKIKNGYTILSSSSIYIPKNMITSSTLLRLQVSNLSNKYSPSGLDSQDLHILNFDDWWNEVIFDDKKYQLTRKDIVCFVSNQDGGAHVDSSLDKRYAALTKFNSLGWEDYNGNPVGGNPAYAAIRQIVDEVLITEDILKKDILRREKVINREFDMIFIDETRRFAWVRSNDDSLLENVYKRERRKVYIQRYKDGSRIPILTL